MSLVDTHCHIHSADFPLPVDEVEERAIAAGVMHFICVGTDVANSAQAVQFVQKRGNHWASIGIHPHEAKDGESALRQLATLVKPDAKIVAIGECGLDYFYGHSPKEAQEKALRFQIELALSHDLPLIFHVRDAFDDFWPIFDSYQGIRGVVHSFTDSRENLEKLLDRGLYVGINGITTFTKNEWQLENAKSVPLERLLLETDAPFLTPVPLRGRVNEPANVRLVAEFLANLRNVPLETLITQTTHNSLQLFSI